MKKQGKNNFIERHTATKILFLMLVSTLFLVPIVSAWEFDNIKSYDKGTQTAKIKNAFGLGEDIAEITLNTPHRNIVPIGYQMIAEIELNSFDDNYLNVLSKMELFDIRNDNEKFKRQIDYKYLTTRMVEVNVQVPVVDKNNNTIDYKDEKKLIEEEYWEKFDFDNVKKGNYKIGLFMQVNYLDEIEWIPTFYGVEIKEWAIVIQSSGTETTDGAYKVHTFTSNGYFNVTGGTLNVSVLVIGGGAGGGRHTGGGGGAGDYVYDFEHDVVTGNYVVIVGTGGAGGTSGTPTGGNGTESSFDTKSAIGGGGGAGYEAGYFFPDIGASGGGGTSASAGQEVGAIGIGINGNNGGAGSQSPYAGGGGGGSGSQGGDVTTSSGNGGSGTSNSITGSSVGYAGGGGGGGDTSVDGGTASHGGGAGGDGGGNAGIVGTINTGGGGGGGSNNANGGAGGSGIIIIKYLSLDNSPVIVLNKPTNNTNQTTNAVTFNCTASDDINLVNVSLILDGVVNETNSSGINSTFYYFTKNLADGDTYWSCRGADNNSGVTTAGEFLININTTPNIYFNAGVPVNNYNSTTNSFEVNVTLTETYFKNITFDLYDRLGALNQSVTFTNTSRDKEWTNLIDGDYSYNVTTATTINQFNQTATRNISIDATIPDVDVFYPPEIIGHHLINTNLSINWSANDTNLDSCILEFEGVNRTLTCSDNQTQINITNIINKSFILYVNDSFGHITITSKAWNYTIFENSQTFNDIVFEGDIETFTANITLEESTTITIANLFYNGTSYPGTFSESGNYSILTIDFTILPVSTETNITFIWNVQLSDDQSINLTSHNQTITEISLDDCSVNSIVLYNYTLVDEGNQTLIWGNQTAPSDRNITIEFNLNLLDVGRTKYIANFTKKYSNVNPFAVCLNKNLNSSTYSVDSVVKYEALTYSVEYYNIVDSTITNSTLPINITLYDLATADATEFKISFKGEDFVFVENALIYIDRQYISENNSFKTVELPKTDSDGQTIGHFVRNDIIYNIRVTKNGEVLGNFENIIAFCQDYTIGNCQIVLEATPSNAVMFNYDKELGITFQSVPTYNNNTHAISFSFSTYDGTPKTVLMEVTRSDIFGNRSLCNHTLTSASGTLSCTIDPNIDDTSLITSVYVDNQLAVLGNVELEASDYGNLGYVLWFFLTFLFIFLFGNSKTEVLIGLVVSLTGAIALGITRGNIIGIGSAGIWMIVIVILGIYKINKENPQ